LNRSMDVGLEGVLLTRCPSSLSLAHVPYSGEDEFGLAWSDPGCGTQVFESVAEGKRLRLKDHL
jgi:hypothetical protein